MVADAGRQINVASAAHAQVFYAHVDNNKQARGINGPLFTRQVCGGANMNGALLNPDDFQGRNPLDCAPERAPWQYLVGNEHVLEAWPGNPLGLNVRVPTPVKKGDAYKTGTHYRSKYNPNLPPTACTMGLISTLGPGVINMEGAEQRVPTKQFGFIGKANGSYKNDPTTYLKRHEKNRTLKFPTRFHYPDEDTCHPRPPKASEALARSMSYTAPNFLVQNQVDCIMEGTKRSLLRKSHDSTLGKSLTNKSTGKLALGKSNPQNAITREPTLEEKSFLDAQRADFECILKGNDLKASDRMHKLSKVIKNRETVKKSQETLRPHTVQPKKEKRNALSFSSDDGPE